MNTKLTGNRQLVREFNTHLLLNVIKDAGSISHADITRTTGLSGATVSSIVKDLKEEGFVKTGGAGKSELGRKPTLLHFNPEARFIIGATFFADQTRIAVLDLCGCIKKRIKFPTDSDKGPESVFERFAHQTETLIEDSGIPKKKFLGIGASFEGVIDNESGEVLFSARLGWRNVSARQEIETRLGLKTVIDADGVTMVLAEHKYGVGRGRSHIICIDIDAGIGSAVLMHGQTCHGSHKMAGEIGHTTVVRDGAECRCGKKGCLESIASGDALVGKAR